MTTPPAVLETTEKVEGNEIEEMGELPTLPLGTTTFPDDPAAVDSGSTPTRICPYCAEQIKPAAIKCKHCLADLSQRSIITAPTARSQSSGVIAACRQCSASFKLRPDFPSRLARCNRCGGVVDVFPSLPTSGATAKSAPTVMSTVVLASVLTVAAYWFLTDRHEMSLNSTAPATSSTTSVPIELVTQTTLSGGYGSDWVAFTAFKRAGSIANLRCELTGGYHYKVTWKLRGETYPIQLAFAIYDRNGVQLDSFVGDDNDRGYLGLMEFLSGGQAAWVTTESRASAAACVKVFIKNP